MRNLRERLMAVASPKPQQPAAPVKNTEPFFCREHVVPIGKANVVREGTDVTIVSWSLMVQVAVKAAEKLAEEGISAEVIDIRSIVPLDKETIFRSIEKTGKLVILHEAVRTGGFGAEIAATIADEAFQNLKAPIQRVTAPDCPSPMTPALEWEYLPNEQKVMDAVKKCMQYK